MSSEEIKKEYKKVSVIVPNYNYAKYLKWRILSIAQQTYLIYELIVLDDASTDGSKTVIKKMVAEAGRMKPEMKIKLIWNKKNSGKAISQWIKGVEAASGDYIWIAEADDISRKDFLVEVMKGFENPDVVLSYAESAIINKYGILLMPNFRRSRDKEGTGHFAKSYIRSGQDEIKEIMAIRCTIPNVSAVVFKNTPNLLRSLKQAEKFEQVGDWYLYAKLLEKGKIFYNRKALNFFRLHKESATKRGEVHVKEVAMMHEYFKNKYDLDKTVLGWMGMEMKRIKAKYGIIE
ncbi:MAG: glycosyltransferase family 2 protein [Candidatus Saccharibacteria bacterium]|nr:glycosyltransferase family 2 protein [Candidatus Saccharibacteria bacterium]